MLLERVGRGGWRLIWISWEEELSRGEGKGRRNGQLDPSTVLLPSVLSYW